MKQEKSEVYFKYVQSVEASEGLRVYWAPFIGYCDANEPDSFSLSWVMWFSHQQDYCGNYRLWLALDRKGVDMVGVEMYTLRAYLTWVHKGDWHS